MAGKIIVANWKMNPDTPREARDLASGIKRRANRLKKTKTVICPPAPFIPILNLDKGKAKLGAQNLYFERAGSYTGEVSANILKYSGVKYVLIGHSERRAMGETDEIVNKKIKRALDAKIIPIVCIGERERDDHGEYLKFIQKQILEGFRRISSRYAKNVIIAYEPIWAIGAKSKGADSPEDFLHTSIFIRKVLSQIFGSRGALSIPVLYGGSANPKNSAGFLNEGQASGLLVGRASLDAETFNEMLEIAEDAK